MNAAGTAVYRIAFDLPASVSRGGEKGNDSRGAVRIDLGRVENIAGITLNCKGAGEIYLSEAYNDWISRSSRGLS